MTNPETIAAWIAANTPMKAAPICANCSQAHPTWRCPEIRAHLIDKHGTVETLRAQLDHLEHEAVALDALHSRAVDERDALRAELAALTKAGNMAYDALDWELECYDGEDGPPPDALLNAHMALYRLLRYTPEPVETGDDLPF